MTRAAIYEMQVQVQVTNCGSRDQLSPGLSILKLGIVKCGVATRCQMLQGCFGFRIFPLERYFALCGPCVCVWHMENVPERQKGNRQPAGGSSGRDVDDGNRIDRSVSWSKSVGDSKRFQWIEKQYVIVNLRYLECYEWYCEIIRNRGKIHNEQSLLHLRRTVPKKDQ